MPSIYVYAPISGTTHSRFRAIPFTCPPDPVVCENSDYINNATGDYCNNCCHPSPYCSAPIDIGASGGAVLDFWGSAAVRSIVCSPTYGNVCADPSVGSPWDDGLAIEMWTGQNATGTKIGTLWYAHVASPYSGTVNTINGGVTYVGYVPSSLCGCRCYQGHHVHMEKCGNSVFNSAVGCTQSVVEDSTWIYRYDY